MSKLADIGNSMQSTGERMASCGGSLVKLGCSGFILLVVVLIVAALLSSSHGGPATSVTTPAEEHSASAKEPAPELRIGSTATLKGEQSGEEIEATVVAYHESIAGGEYNKPPEGMKYVGVTFRLKNVGTLQYSDSPSNGAVILTSSGQRGKTAILTEGSCSEGFAESVKLAPGESQEGCLAFELPESIAAARFQWTPSNGYGEETADWSLSSTPAPGEAPRFEMGTGAGSEAKSCGSELDGSEDTSCAFAHEILKAFVAEYASKGVPPADISAYSPVTRRTYALKCTIDGGDTEIECTTTTGNATVVFPLAEAQRDRAEEESSR